MSEKRLPSLKAMAEGGQAGVQKLAHFKVDPRLVEFEEGFNLRQEGPELDAHLEAMYVAMKAGAQFPPIDVSVVDGRIIARDGHCRTRTAKRLIEEGIDYKLEARQFRGNDADCVFHMLGTGNGSKGYTPLESGLGYLRLLRYGHDEAAIAARLGVSRTTIDNGLILAEAPAEIQQMISSGKVAAHVAIDMIRKHGSKATEKLREAIDRTGKKVTKKHVGLPRIPHKVATAYHDATDSLMRFFDESPTEKAAMEEGKTVMVPGTVLAALLSAHESLKTKK